MDGFYGFAGVPMEDIVRQIHKAADVPCGEERCDAFLESLSAAQHREEERRGSPDRIECVISLATDALAAGLKIAVATRCSFVLSPMFVLPSMAGLIS